MNRVFTLMFVLVASSVVFSQTETPKNDGNELLQRCSELVRHADGGFKSSDFGSDWCLGYIEGFLDVFETLAPTDSKSYVGYLEMRNLLFCIPDAVTVGQDARVLVKYLRDHPERLHEREPILLAAALHEAFPCQQQPVKSK